MEDNCYKCNKDAEIQLSQTDDFLLGVGVRMNSVCFKGLDTKSGTMLQWIDRKNKLDFVRFLFLVEGGIQGSKESL